MGILLSVERRARNGNNSIFISHLYAESIIFCTSVPLFILFVLLHNLNAWYVCHYEKSSLRNPQIEVIFTVDELFKQNVTVLGKFSCVLFYVLVVRVTYRFEAFCYCILNYIVRAEHSILMNWPDSFDQMRRPNHPSTSDTGGCEYFSRRVNTDSSIVHAFDKSHFRQLLIIHIIESHSFVDIILNYNYLRVFFQNTGNILELLHRKDFSDRIMRGI